MTHADLAQLPAPLGQRCAHPVGHARCARPTGHPHGHVAVADYITDRGAS